MADTTEQLDRPCPIDGCDWNALPFSEPARCPIHIDDLERWYDHAIAISAGLASDNTSDASGMKAMIMRAMLKNLYRESLLHRPYCGGLYQSFKHSVDPRDKVAFSFADVIYFSLAAAASGIIGHLAYDAVKGVIKRIGEKNEATSLEQTFEETVAISQYEEFRIKENGEGDPLIEVDTIIQTDIERKYKLIVRDNEK
jgi:hypothetical protein